MSEAIEREPIELTYCEELAIIVAEKRRRLGLSARQVAELVGGLTEKTVYRVEKMEGGVTYETGKRLEEWATRGLPR